MQRAPSWPDALISVPESRQRAAEVGAGSARVDLLRRLIELDRQLKERHASAATGRDRELDAWHQGIAELHCQLEDMRTSESWRLGNSIVRGLLAIGRPFAAVVRPPRRAWRSRRANHDRVYRRAVAAGAPLATGDAASLVPGADATHEPLASLVH